jgi:uncharacterized protein YdaL
MRTILIALCLTLMFLGVSSGGEYTYKTSEDEDFAIAWAANRDAVTLAVAYEQLVKSMLAQLIDEMRKDSENILMKSARQYISQDKSFTIKFDQSMAKGECK